MQLNALFGNLEEIIPFQSEFLESLEVSSMLSNDFELVVFMDYSLF